MKLVDTNRILLSMDCIKGGHCLSVFNEFKDTNIENRCDGCWVFLNNLYKECDDCNEPYVIQILLAKHKNNIGLFNFICDHLFVSAVRLHRFSTAEKYLDNVHSYYLREAIRNALLINDVNILSWVANNEYLYKHKLSVLEIYPELSGKCVENVSSQKQYSDLSAKVDGLILHTKEYN